MRFPMYSSTVVCTPLLPHGYTSTPLRIPTYYDVTINMNLHITPSIPFVINPSWRSHDLLSDTLPIEVSALSNHMPDAHEAIK